MSKYPSVICYICGEKASCTQPRDFGHLKPGWEQEEKKQHKEHQAE